MAQHFTWVKDVNIGDEEWPDVVGVYRNDATGRYHVVREHGEGGHQVVSVMPGDQPTGGGQWFAHNNDAGIAYVSRGYSRSYVNQRLRRMRDEEPAY